MAILLFSVCSDGIGLLVLSCFGMNIEREMQLRILPNIVLVIGLLSFSTGLLLSNPVAKSIGYDLSSKDKKTKQRILAASYFLIFLGFFMKFYALLSWGFTSLGEYFSGMYMYQATKMGGGFMDAGLGIALMGFSLLVASHGDNRSKQFIIIILMFIASFTLTLSKSGVHSLVIVFAVTLYFFNKKLFKQFAQPKSIAVLFFVFIFVLGIRTQIKYGQGAEISIAPYKVVETSVSVMGRRYGPFGVYRGYSFLINRLAENPSLFFGTTVIEHALTGWIPRFIWPDKPGHPFHARGDLVNEDFSVDQYGNDASSFAGAAFADNGYQSLILYCFAGGFLLGLIRRAVTSKSKHHFLLILGYTFFTIRFGSNMEGAGLISIFYFMAFSAILVLIVFTFLMLRNMFRTVLTNSLHSRQTF